VVLLVDVLELEPVEPVFGLGLGLAEYWAKAELARTSPARVRIAEGQRRVFMRPPLL